MRLPAVRRARRGPHAPLGSRNARQGAVLHQRVGTGHYSASVDAASHKGRPIGKIGEIDTLADGGNDARVEQLPIPTVLVRRFGDVLLVPLVLAERLLPAFDAECGPLALETPQNVLVCQAYFHQLAPAPLPIHAWLPPDLGLLGRFGHDGAHLLEEDTVRSLDLDVSYYRFVKIMQLTLLLDFSVGVGAFGEHRRLPKIVADGRLHLGQTFPVPGGVPLLPAPLEDSRRTRQRRGERHASVVADHFDY